MHSSHFAGKRQLEDSMPMEQTKSIELILKRQKIKEKTSDIVFGATGPGSLALGNPIIMEKIVGFLDKGDICRWYDSSKTFKSKIDQMDDIFWRREAQKLAAVLRSKNEDSLEEQWPGKTIRDIIFILKSDVERLVAKIRAIFYPHPYPLNVSHIADAASLAHHGFLGSVRGLSMKKVYLSSMPIEHLVSLVACVKKKLVDVVFHNFPKGRYDGYLLAILDNVQCECLSVTVQWLGTKGTRALVRAMRTRVRKLCVGLGGFFGGIEEAHRLKELIKYDGKGKCEQVDSLEMNYIELQNRRDIELWVKDCKWKVLSDKANFLLVKRK